VRRMTCICGWSCTDPHALDTVNPIASSIVACSWEVGRLCCFIQDCGNVLLEI
jgi:hypothetical protein